MASPPKEKKTCASGPRAKKKVIDQATRLNSLTRSWARCFLPLASPVQRQAVEFDFEVVGFRDEATQGVVVGVLVWFRG